MLQLVKNEHQYYEFIRKLRNDDNVKRGFIEQGFISIEQQEKYMSRYSDNYQICLEDGVPVGYIGQIDNDIRLAVLPNFQGKGIGEFMVNKFMKIYPNAFAKVKMDNIASLKLFKKCGFKEKYIILELE